MIKIWIALVILTLLSFTLGTSSLAKEVLLVLLLMSTFVKGQLVIDYFMELKQVTLVYRLIPSLWLNLVILAIALAYYLPVPL